MLIVHELLDASAHALGCLTGENTRVGHHRSLTGNDVGSLCSTHLGKCYRGANECGEISAAASDKAEDRREEPEVSEDESVAEGRIAREVIDHLSRGRCHSDGERISVDLVDRACKAGNGCMTFGR